MLPFLAEATPRISRGALQKTWLGVVGVKIIGAPGDQGFSCGPTSVRYKIRFPFEARRSAAANLHSHGLEWTAASLSRFYFFSKPPPRGGKKPPRRADGEVQSRRAPPPSFAVTRWNA